MNDSHIVECGTERVSPLKSNVLVRPDPPDEKTAGGLLFKPDTIKTRSQRGTVVAVGPACTSVQVLDRVLFTYWSAIHLDVNGLEHFLYREEDILACLHGEEPAHDQG